MTFLAFKEAHEPINNATFYAKERHDIETNDQ